MPIDTPSRRVRAIDMLARPKRARTAEVEGLEERRLLTTYVVNSLADILTTPAGTVTLRSAIQIANQAAASGSSNTIDLAIPGTYRITTLGHGATDNSAGEFAITGAAGSSLTITNTSGGRVIVDGGRLNRVFDVNPSAALGAFQATFQSLTITGGVAAGDGGGVRALGSAEVDLDNVELDDNVASGGGGGVSVATGILSFLNCTVVGNDAGHGGAAYSQSSAYINGHNSFFQGNVAANAGGVLDIGGTGEAYFDRDDFRANLAASGGAIADEVGTTKLSLESCTLDQNRALRGDGGALFASISATDQVLLGRCLFLDNAANNASLGAGGAIAQTGGMLGLGDSQLTGNTADAHGGAVDFNGVTLYGSGDTIDHSSTDGEGGALYFAGTGQGVLVAPGSSLIDMTFAFNSASGGGGGIYDAATGDLGLVYDTINANDGGQGGGGIELASGGKLAIGATIIAQNRASLTALGPDVLTGLTLHVTDEGSNLVGDNSGGAGFNPGALIGTSGHAIDPGLGPLLDNGNLDIYGSFFSGAGGPGNLVDVRTEALSASSPAFNASTFSGPMRYPVTQDERRFPLSATTPSIGAYQPQYASTATPAQIFVENLYELLLNRPADPGGLAYWSSRVDPSGLNEPLIRRFETSEEYRTDQVESFYTAYFFTEPEPGAVAGWVERLDSGALTLGQVQADFLGSPEYLLSYGNNVVTATEEIYEELLDRVPLASEVDGWVRVSQMGVGPGVIALDFVLSQEDETDLILADYQSLLGRSASTDEVASRLKPLAGSTDPKTLLIAAILGSPEAYADRG